MDSEHRHELKSNALAELITHFPQFLKRNANTIIGVSLIVVALITWPLFTKMSREKALAQESKIANAIQMLNQDLRLVLQRYEKSPEQLDSLLNTVLANANALMDQASETDNSNLTALAYIKAAQAIRTELHLRRNLVSTETVDTQIQKAQQAYEKAADIAETANLKAMAQFGIGLCAEERRQTDQAGEIYKNIIGDEDFAVTVFPKLAQQRLDNLGENAASFTFEDIKSEEADILLSSPEDVSITETDVVESDSEK